MQTIFEDFSFLLHIDVPEKIPITHRFVERLLKIRSHQQKLHNHQDLEQQVFQAVLKMVKAEESFLIAKLEYETKEARFVKLTDYNETRLDILFSKVDLMFKDIDETALLEAIEIKSFDKLISSVRKSINLMKIATDVCYERMDLITKEWVNISEELLIKLKNFEQRGLKKVSNNLRLKLIPEIRELKALLREKPVKGAGSREEIEQKVLNMVEQAKSD
ncbi:MAG: hypothetical protein IH840_16090, partial [Candidatus Heimdallarchaeota archaeon]|nr:hypothetical protein [Candidatus Heimdallarchaeota archaeon]